MNATASKRKFDYSSMTPEAYAALREAGFTRRSLLRGAGFLVVGFAMGGGIRKVGAQTAGPPYPPIPLNQTDSWIAIGADGGIMAFSGRCDFGQGFATVQHQLVAEELMVPIERVSMIICDTAITPDQGTSSGSQAHPVEFGPSALRQALATAREALFRMASERLNVPMDQLTASNGVISVRGDASRSVTYGGLVAGRRFNLTINARATPISPRTYKVLGTSVGRYDIPQKVTGEFEYVHHVRLPGMLHGKVVRPSGVNAKLVSVDENSVRGMPGNVRVVVKGNFVGVVADTEWQATQAASALKVTWSDGDPLPKQEELFTWMRQQPTRDAYVVRADDVDDNMKKAARTFEFTYYHPYQIHGSLGTSCSVADVYGTGPDGIATIWSATQGVYPQRDSVANVLGIPRQNIRVIFVEGSGCYGINGADTVSFDAALLSQAVGKPVRVQYSRRDEMIWADHFGPAFIINLKAGVDDKGQIIAWDHESWALSRGGRPNATTPGNIVTGYLTGFTTPPVVPAAANPPTAYNNGANASSSYGAGCVGASCGGTGNIRSERVLTHTMWSPFFTGPLRSPNRLQNNFAHESFIDEVASALRQDPVQYRLRHLSDPRMIDVVNAAARGANWDQRPSPKPGNARTGVVTGRGISCVLYEGDNGYCALVAEVEVDQATGRVVVKRFVQSQDSGPISNPDGLKNQMEGGTLQGMSRALMEEVKWNDKALTSVDWRSYPVYRFGDFTPKIENILINRPDAEQMGAGECTITIVNAAIANAIFDATGARIRQVPFTPDRVLAALRART